MLEKATFGGGCFWCTHATFSELKGVYEVLSGYSGGNDESPSYETVCTGKTGHAEVIHITFNPDEISFEDLVTIHMTTHNPTTLNQQGEDIGTQYRSIILTHNENQALVARKVINELSSSFEDPIVTSVETFSKFYPAENYHQDYYQSNQDKPYCEAVINPKLTKFRQKYKDKLKSK